MAEKVLRLKTTGNVPLTSSIDWYVSNEYSTTIIQSFPDPDGGKGNEPTSIPSPFARIDLARTAFKYVNEGAKEDTTFYKIVSDCLDVAEIFFNYNRLKDNLLIHEWDIKQDIEELKNSLSKEHRTLGESLELYLTQDSKSFNFDKLSKFYLLEYKNVIIGGTSPITLFFPSANNLDWVDINFPNGDKAFDDEYCPLFKRDPEFQKLLYSMREYIPNYRAYFRDFSDYMDNSLKDLKGFNNNLYNEINNEITKKGQSFNLINYDSILGGVFVIHSVPFYASKGIEIVNSDFEISSTKYLKGNRPLVLQKGHNGLLPDGSPMRYHTANYDPRTNVEHFEEIVNFDERLLPGLGIKYPYITICDIFEPYIVRTIFPINGKYFLNISQSRTNKGYLLPIKKIFFDFFNINELKQTTNDGKPIFELVEGGHGEVKAILRIPIKNKHYIVYERIYYPPINNKPAVPDERNNKGSIAEHDFSLSVYPLIRLKKQENNYYRIGIIDSDILTYTKNITYALNFYKLNGEKTKIVANQKRTDKAKENVNSSHYVINEDVFDLIEVSVGSNVKGIAIPIFNDFESGVKSSIFSVDFGTTNTHIEYYIGDGNIDPKPFEIIHDFQIGFLHKVEDDILNEQTEDLEKQRIARSLNRIITRFLYETMPEVVKKDSDFSFPLRTAIASKSSLNILSQTYTLADLNIPFYYEKTSFKSQTDNVEKNLKWDGRKEGNKEYLFHYFENLMFLIRNKVLINGGDLDKLKLVCTYPVSMLSWRRELMEKEWNSLYKVYISEKTTPIFISESIAPFYYLRKRGGITAVSKPVISIDIGGETTDIVVYINDNPKIISSARFATNAIFGDGFNCNPQTNGFVLKYKPIIQNLLEQNKLEKLKRVIERVNEESNSSDIINMFFSLENNKVLNPNSLVSFNKELSSDNNFKIIFVLFYTSILYHISRIMKCKHIDSPAYITFSGMGSKVINFIGQKSLEKITNILFEKFDGHSKVVLNQPDDPKEITARGAIFFDSFQNIESNSLKTVLIGDSENTIVDSNSMLTYKNITEQRINSVAKEYMSFIYYFESLNSKINFRDNFGFSYDDFQRFKILLTDQSKVIEYIKLGIESKLIQLDNKHNEPIEESLFFYPLIGMMNRLAFEIYNEESK